MGRRLSKIILHRMPKLQVERLEQLLTGWALGLALRHAKIRRNAAKRICREILPAECGYGKSNVGVDAKVACRVEKAQPRNSSRTQRRASKCERARRRVSHSRKKKVTSATQKTIRTYTITRQLPEPKFQQTLLPSRGIEHGTKRTPTHHFISPTSTALPQHPPPPTTRHLTASSLCAAPH